MRCSSSTGGPRAGGSEQSGCGGAMWPGVSWGGLVQRRHSRTGALHLPTGGPTSLGADPPRGLGLGLPASGRRFLQAPAAPTPPPAVPRDRPGARASPGQAHPPSTHRFRIKDPEGEVADGERQPRDRGVVAVIGTPSYFLL